MKARKAMKRLKRVDTLLSSVIDHYDSGTSEVKALLGAARTSVTSAAGALASLPVEPPAAKSNGTKRTFSDATRKRLSIAAKKRWASAKRIGANSLAKPAGKAGRVRTAAAS